MISFIYFSHSLYRPSKDEQIIGSRESAETTSSTLTLSRISQLVCDRESRGGDTAKMDSSLHPLHIHTESSRSYKWVIHNLINNRESRKNMMRGQKSFSLILERNSNPFAWS